MGPRWFPLSSGFTRVAALGDLSEGFPHRATLPDGTDVCLIRVGEEVYALQDRCTHAEFAMHDGDMVDDYVIECALHGAQFDVRTGEVLELPATESLPRYEVKIEDGDILVRVEESQAGQ